MSVNVLAFAELVPGYQRGVRYHLRWLRHLVAPERNQRAHEDTNATVT